MTIQHYQDRAMSTCMDTCMNPVYMLMNLGAEVGELQGKIAKAVAQFFVAAITAYIILSLFYAITKYVLL